jgi:hypothetical protein
MLRLFVLLIVFVGWSKVKLLGQEAVLVELFTYDGCAHCMLANRALRNIENDTTLNRNTIFLSHHVDYDMHDHFHDSLDHPFSRMRQQEFVKQGICSGIFTPQLVVNGTSCVPVSNRKQVVQLLHSLAPNSDRIDASTSISRRNGGFSVELDFAAESDTAYTIYLVLLENERVVSPKSGDNVGATLVHRNCLIEARRFNYRPSFWESFRFSEAILNQPERYSALVFLQHNHSGQIRLPKLYPLHQIR